MTPLRPGALGSYPNLSMLLALQCWSYHPCLNHDRRPTQTLIPNSTCLHPKRSTKSRAQSYSEGNCHPSSFLTTPCTSLTSCSAEAKTIQTFAETGKKFWSWFLDFILPDSTSQGLPKIPIEVILASSSWLHCPCPHWAASLLSIGTVSGITTRWDHFPQCGRDLMAHHILCTHG